MRFRLFVAVLAVLVLAAPAIAGQELSVPPCAKLVKRATVEPMRDPAGAFAIQFISTDTAFQCELLPDHRIAIIEKTGIGAAYVVRGEDAGTHFCTIFTPDARLTWVYRTVVARYALGSDAPTPLVIQ